MPRRLERGPCGPFLILGEWVDRDHLPEGEEYLGVIIRDICCVNARDQFSLLPKQAQ